MANNDNTVNKNIGIDSYGNPISVGGTGMHNPLAGQFSSENVGSGVQTTTGGTYRNPKLGIADTTAFGRGFASTFQIPKPPEEIDDLNNPFSTFSTTDRNDFLQHEDGNTYGMQNNQTLIDSYERGELAILNKQYKAFNNAGNQKGMARILSQLDAYKADIGGPDSNWGKTLAMLNHKTNDVNVSNLRLPGTNGEQTDLTWAQYSKINTTNPRDITIGSKINDQDVVVRGFNVYDRKRSQTFFVNATHMDDKYRNDNFHAKFNASDHLKIDYGRVDMANKSVSYHNIEDTVIDSSGNEVRIKEGNKYVQNGTVITFDGIAKDAGDQFWSSVNDDLYESGWHQLSSSFDDGSFMPSNDNLSLIAAEFSQINPGILDDNNNPLPWAQYTNDQKLAMMERVKGNIGNTNFNWHQSGLSDDLKVELLKDNYAEQFKINNGKGVYAVGADGRAIANTYANHEFWQDREGDPWLLSRTTTPETKPTSNIFNINTGDSSTIGMSPFDPASFSIASGVIGKGMEGDKGDFNILPGSNAEAMVGIHGGRVWKPTVIDFSNDATFNNVANQVRNITGFKDGRLFRTSEFRDSYIREKLADTGTNGFNPGGKVTDVNNLTDAQLKTIDLAMGAFDIGDSDLVYVEDQNKSSERPIPVDSSRLRSGSFLFSDVVEFYKQFKHSDSKVDIQWKKDMEAYYKNSPMYEYDKRIEGAVIGGQSGVNELHEKHRVTDKDQAIKIGLIKEGDTFPPTTIPAGLQKNYTITSEGHILNTLSWKQELETVNTMRATKKYGSKTTKLEYIPDWKRK